MTFEVEQVLAARCIPNLCRPTGDRENPRAVPGKGYARYKTPAN
jgi:hypothetical protein